jgi:hypothetical protein
MFGTIQIRTSLILGYTAFSVLKICKRIFWREKKIRFSLNNSSYPLPNYLEFIHKVWDHKRLAKFHTLPHFSFWICQKKKNILRSSPLYANHLKFMIPYIFHNTQNSLNLGLIMIVTVPALFPCFS